MTSSTRPAHSYTAQAEAVALVARREALKAIKMRDSETELTLARLEAAVTTLRELAHRERAGR